MTPAAQPLDPSIPGRRQSARLRATAERMEPEDAVDWLLELIELSLPEFNAAGLGNLILWGFNPQQARLLSVLLAAGPAGASHDRLAWAISNSGTPASPDHARLIVLKCRGKLRRLGWPVSIISLWGFGYRAEIAPGFKMPKPLPLPE